MAKKKKVDPVEAMIETLATGVAEAFKDALYTAYENGLSDGYNEANEEIAKLKKA